MNFTKMHGIGNDYVYVNGFEETVPEPEKLALAVSDRHYGIGSDGLILVLPSEQADVRMRMFNADGSEAEMCGNGLRCLSKFAYEHKLVNGREALDGACVGFLRQVYPQAEQIQEFTVETGAGILTVYAAVIGGQVERIGVNMGKPILLPTDIPVNVVGQQAVGIPFEIEDRHYLMTCVSMGNPHAVFYVDDVAAIPLERIGPLVEKHPMFPRRVNAHFVQVVGPEEVIMRTWERGSGITLACGTGAAAVCVAGILASKTGPEVLIHLPGGDLNFQWNQEDQNVYMVGPATTVFIGEWLQ